jgi:hypothetical protein
VRSIGPGHARKRLRRVALGPIMTLVFECVDTVRFQIQEMARVEKILSDEAIQVELDIYNRLLPQVGELSATLFIELTSDALLREWLPKLVGIERALGWRSAGRSCPACPRRPMRRRWSATRSHRRSTTCDFASRRPRSRPSPAPEEVALVASHPEYEARAPFCPGRCVEELLGTCVGTTKPLPIG